MIRRTLAAALALAASAAVALDPGADYMLAAWDGRETAPGLWFEIDGAEAPPTIRLARVWSVPEGLEVRAAAGRLTLSADLARHLGVTPGAPALIAVRDLAAEEPGFSAEAAARLGVDSADPAEAPDRAGAVSAQAALADHAAEVERIFGALRARADRADADAVPAAARRRTEAEAAPVVIEARRGGLVPYGWAEDAARRDAP